MQVLQQVDVLLHNLLHRLGQHPVETALEEALLMGVSLVGVAEWQDYFGHDGVPCVQQAGGEGLCLGLGNGDYTHPHPGLHLKGDYVSRSLVGAPDFGHLQGLDKLVPNLFYAQPEMSIAHRANADEGAVVEGIGVDDVDDGPVPITQTLALLKEGDVLAFRAVSDEAGEGINDHQTSLAVLPDSPEPSLEDPFRAPSLPGDLNGEYLEAAQKEMVRNIQAEALHLLDKGLYRVLRGVEQGLTSVV